MPPRSLASLNENSANRCVRSREGTQRKTTIHYTSWKKLEAEVKEHTHRAQEEEALAEKAEKKLESVRAYERKEQHQVRVVVDGVEYEVPYKENDLLGSLIPRALEEAGVVGRTGDKWQIKWNGQLLDLNAKMAALHLPKNALLFLSLEAGTLG